MCARKIPRISVHIKKVIVALKNKRMSYTELEGLRIPHRTVSDILKNYLGYWGLVKKEKGRFGRWYWYEEIKEFKNRSQYELFMQHTKDLVPALRMLVTQDLYFFWLDPPVERFKIFPAYLDEKSRVPFVEEHLRTGHVEIYDQLTELRGLTLKEDIENESWLNPKCEELYNKMAGKIDSLLMKIRTEPLQGTCRSCPRVLIRDDNNEHSNNAIREAKRQRRKQKF